MKKDGYYTSGEFARMAHVSVRTIRFYDQQQILKPSLVSEAGARFYTDQDFGRLQQILLLKYLGFPLEDIKEMTINDTDYHFMLNALKVQLKLVQDKIEQMQLVEKAIEDATEEIKEKHTLNWSHMLDLIHLTGMEKSFKSQYKNATNISARIHLHRLYAQNPEGWFPWIFKHCHLQDDMKVLELGCGNGALWTSSLSKLPDNISLTLSDISEGMIRDLRREIGAADHRFEFDTFDCHNIPYEDETFDLVIANHVLFYCEDIPKICAEVRRLLKPGGRFICSTYSARHMKEVTDLVQEFDSRITLSAQKLYEKFGLENGASWLLPYFSAVTQEQYPDELLVTEPEPLIEYVLSCHGTQNQYILDRYKEFRNFVERKTKNTFHITKDAGIFICTR